MRLTIHYAVGGVEGAEGPWIDLIDGDRLLVSVEGYTYCLQPLTGKGLWYNRLTGYGTGIPSLASVHGNSNQRNPSAVAALVEEERRRSG